MVILRLVCASSKYCVQDEELLAKRQKEVIKLRLKFIEIIIRGVLRDLLVAGRGRVLMKR